MIDWIDHYKIGVDKIDRQHEEIISTINQLIILHEAAKDKNAVMTVFIGLINYFIYHFEREEILMSEYGYSDLERRRYENDMFCNNLEIAKLDYINGDLPSLAYIIDYIKIWLIDHIVIEDKKFSSECGLTV